MYGKMLFIPFSPNAIHNTPEKKVKIKKQLSLKYLIFTVRIGYFKFLTIHFKLYFCYKNQCFF